MPSRRSGFLAQRSLEELRFVAAAILALKGAVTAIELRAALDLGATIANSDAAIVLEWDGHLWHTSKERVADDVLKTSR